MFEFIKDAHGGIPKPQSIINEETEEKIEELQKEVATLKEDLVNTLIGDERREKFYDKLNTHDQRVLDDRLERLETEHEILWKKVKTLEKKPDPSPSKQTLESLLESKGCINIDEVVALHKVMKHEEMKNDN